MYLYVKFIQRCEIHSSFLTRVLFEVSHGIDILTWCSLLFVRYVVQNTRHDHQYQRKRFMYNKETSFQLWRNGPCVEYFACNKSKDIIISLTSMSMDLHM